MVLACGGYPGDYETGKAITGIDEAEAIPGVTVYHAGTKLADDGTLVTAGGRVLNVTAVGADVRRGARAGLRGGRPHLVRRHVLPHDIGAARSLAAGGA